MIDLRAWAEPGLQYPRRVLLAAVILLAVCASLSATLGVDSSRLTMVSSDHPHQALQMQHVERFGPEDALVFVVRGGEIADRRQLVDVLARAVDDATDDPVVVLGRVTPATMAELLLLGPSAQRPDGIDGLGYLHGGHLDQHYVLVFPGFETIWQTGEVAPLVAQLRSVRDEVLADNPSGLTADLTGAPALEVDEAVAIQRGVVVTSFATVAAILVVLAVGFGRFKLVVLALVPVGIGVVATMAAARVVYGELNMVTSSASSILLGLGIDFGVVLLDRLEEERAAGHRLQLAVRRTWRYTGAALLVAAVTSALAFLTTATTEFTAYARLGILVALGLMMMMVSTLVLMPALVRMFDATPSKGGRAHRRGFRWPVRSPRIVLCVSAVAFVAACTATTSASFNPRFFDFLPTGSESARGLAAVEQDPIATPMRATIGVERLDEARRLADALRARPEVLSVATPTDALPPLDLAGIESRLVDAPSHDADPVVRRAWATAMAVVERGAYAPTDLPPALRAQFVSRDGEAIAIHVVPAGDVWDPAVAARFADVVSEIAPNATGLPMHVSTHVRWIRDGFLRAAGLAAVVILLAAAMVFRRPRAVALALIPPVFGFVAMIGAMVAIGLPFDPANVVALPLVLGLSIDAGIHMVHRATESRRAHGVARVCDVVDGTGRAVGLALATTTCGFAGLLLADYGAMQSLGAVMVIGLSAAAAGALVIVPAVLAVTGGMQDDVALIN